MKRQQVMLVGAGVIILLSLYFFGQTVPPVKKRASTTNGPGSTEESTPKSIDLEDILQAAKSRLNPSQLSYVTRLENSVVRGDVKKQQWIAYRQLITFWGDSVKEGFLPFAYYNGQAAKLENNEKSLTFAAQLFLNNLRGQDNPALKGWMATQAKELFEKALALNPGNDSTKVGLGASVIFGSSSGNPQETMKGIQQILEVVRRDSTNMYAQFMLALGGVESGQLDKAIERLRTVVRHQPGNVEAILLLAQVYQQTGDKTGAIKEYSAARKLSDNPDMIREIDRLIQSLH